MPSNRAYLAYETPKTRGKGLLRLKQENGKFTRAYTFFSVSLAACGTCLCVQLSPLEADTSFSLLPSFRNRRCGRSRDTKSLHTSDALSVPKSTKLVDQMPRTGSNW